MTQTARARSLRTTGDCRLVDVAVPCLVMVQAVVVKRAPDNRVQEEDVRKEDAAPVDVSQEQRAATNKQINKLTNQ